MNNFFVNNTDTLQALLNTSYPSLGWALSSPPKPYAFVSLQSVMPVLLPAIITAQAYCFKILKRMVILLLYYRKVLGILLHLHDFY